MRSPLPYFLHSAVATRRTYEFEEMPNLQGKDQKADKSRGGKMKKLILALMALCALQPVLAMDPGHAENDGHTPLTRAAQDGDVETCKQLIAAGADVNEPNVHGFTPLYCAISAFETIPIVQLLLNHGANIHTKSHGQTPLFRACKIMQDLPLSKLLLEYGANGNTPESRAGYTPLMIIFLSTSQAQEFAQLLLTHGADIFPQDNINGENALMLAAYLPFERTACRTLLNHQIELGKRMYTLLACLKHASPTHACAKLLYRERKDLLWPHLNCYKLQTLLNAKNKKGETAYDLSARFNVRHGIERLEWLKPIDAKKKDPQ